MGCKTLPGQIKTSFADEKGHRKAKEYITALLSEAQERTSAG